MRALTMAAILFLAFLGFALSGWSEMTDDRASATFAVG